MLQIETTTKIDYCVMQVPRAAELIALVVKQRTVATSA